MDTAKDMYKVYAKTSTIELVRNRNRKFRQLLRLDGIDGYFVNKERDRLMHMIKQIDAVIAQRALQMPLPLEDSTPVRAKSSLISHPAHKIEGSPYFEESTPEDF